MTRLETKALFGAILFLCLGAAIGWYAAGHQDLDEDQSLATSSGQVRANLARYKFINPPLFSDTAKSDLPRFKDIAASLRSYIDSQKVDGSVDSASVYFRDLNAGQWTGVDEDDLYTPSSMLKVVAMMASLKLAESDPSILSEKLHYLRPSDRSPYSFRSSDTLPDAYYSLDDLIGYMIKDSDNGAFDAVVADPKINAEFAEVYSLFRLPPAGLTSTTTDFMSPKSFSAVFRTLYNSSFFEWNLSEQVLSLLSQTTFTKGLVGGVPAGTVVSHKFGENTDELHDCGIIYYPGRPYLLCVMTRGSNARSLETAIQSISKMVWDFVDQGRLTQK